MEDVTSKNNGIAQTFAQLGRPALPSSASESVSTTGGRQLDFTINESKEDVDVPSTRIDAAVVSDDYSSLMTALGTLVLSQGLQSQLQSQPMTADPTNYGLASVDGTFAPAFTAANFQNYQPTMADLYGLQSDGEVVGNFAQQCQQMWPRHDMIAQHRGAPMLSFPADDRNQTGTWGNLQNPSAWPSASGRAGPNVRSGFNHHGRSMSAQNLNMTGVGQSSLRPNDYASGLNSMISGYRHGKPFADQMQRSRFGSSFSSLLENDSKNSNLENETALIQGNQNAILLDFLRNASGSTGQSAGTFPFGVQDLRHLLKDSSGSCSDAAARFTSLNLLKSSSSSTLQSGIDMGELYSRKVFVGGLPPDIDEEEILTSFHRFGSVLVDWPHKTESKSYFPPKGYCFLLFEDEKSVQGLVRACVVENGKLYWHVTSPTMKDKAVQIRPWKLSDCDFVMDGAQPLDPRKTVFVGGVPRPMRAVELAMVMARMYGPVCYAGIDTDPDLKYPKGAGRVTFTSQQSFLAAINSRFVQLQHGDIDKRVEVKPYVLEDQICDECQGLRSGGKHAPFFCANVVCLQYYCDHCWTVVHSNPGREFHKPLVKDGADRPRTMPFRLC